MRRRNVELFLVFLFVFSLLANSCAVDVSKRRYSKGWDIFLKQSQGQKQEAAEKRITKQAVETQFLREENLKTEEIQSSCKPVEERAGEERVSSVYSSQFSDTFTGKPVVQDTAITLEQHTRDINALEEVPEKINRLHILTIAIFVLVMLLAVASGSLLAGAAGKAVLPLFITGIATLVATFVLRFTKVFNILRFLASTEPKHLDAENPYQEEKLKKLFRLMVNAIFFFPFGALVLAIILHRRLRSPKGKEAGELNRFLRRKARAYIIYSCLILLVWLYLAYVSLPYLITTLLLFI